MRSLVARWTAAVALVVSGFVGAIGAAGGLPASLVALRSAVAFGIVATVGWCAGYVLMRTALRRYYEQSRMAQAGSRPRAER